MIIMKGINANIITRQKTKKKKTIIVGVNLYYNLHTPLPHQSANSYKICMYTICRTSAEVS